MKRHNFYEILGIPPSASSEEIDRAYRERVKRFHPDVNLRSGSLVFYENRMRELNEAYNILKDPRKRAVYNTEIGILP